MFYPYVYICDKYVHTHTSIYTYSLMYIYADISESDVVAMRW